MVVTSDSLETQEQQLALQAQSIDSLARAISTTTEIGRTQALSLITHTINPVLGDVDATFDDLIANALKSYLDLVARKAEKAKPFESAKTYIVDQLSCSLAVQSEEDYKRAGEFIVKVINPILGETDSSDGAIAIAHKNWKSLLALRGEKLAPREAAKKVVEVKALRWKAEENRKADERARVERMERERIARETQINRLKEQRAEEISLLMQQGQVDRAQEAISKVMAGDLGPLPKLDIPPVAPSYVAPIAPKVAGVSTRTYWHFQVTNPAEIKREYMTPDEKLIKKIVESKHKGAEEIVGGIQVWSDEGMATRGRR